MRVAHVQLMPGYLTPHLPGCTPDELSAFGDLVIDLGRYRLTAIYGEDSVRVVRQGGRLCFAVRAPDDEIQRVSAHLDRMVDDIVTEVANAAKIEN